MTATAGSLLRSARKGAGLSQRALAARAGTSQSVVARIERGTTSPSWETLNHLIRTAGHELSASVVLAPVVHSHMLADVRRIRALTPEARLAEVANFSRFIQTVERG